MAETGRDCSWEHGLANYCLGTAQWESVKACQLSCYNAGRGYTGDTCCADTPAVCELAAYDAPWHHRMPNVFGLNQVIGPAFQMDYHEPALIQLVQALRVGQLRYPGGTVANYWYMPNGTYGLPCSHPNFESHASGAEGVGGSHDKCSDKATVDRWNSYSPRGRQSVLVSGVVRVPDSFRGAAPCAPASVALT
eukprot:715734-Prymnesium_polylepis.3